jgi:hypothetical protein
MKSHYINAQDPQMVAYLVIGWIVADASRVERFLGLTGLTPDDLRARLTDGGVQAAAFDFLLGHEPDLVACAAEIGETPAGIAAAADAMGYGASA